MENLRVSWKKIMKHLFVYYSVLAKMFPIEKSNNRKSSYVKQCRNPDKEIMQLHLKIPVSCPEKNKPDVSMILQFRMISYAVRVITKYTLTKFLYFR